MVNFSCKNSINVNAVEVEDGEQLKYVSLGDSIAAGHSLTGHNVNNQYGNSNNTSTQIVEGCYTQLFRDNVLKNYCNNIEVVSFARSGQTSGQLLDKLQNDQTVRNEIKDADVITVCIGANDLLTIINSNKTFWNMAMYLADINDDIISDLEEGIKTCSNNYPKIIEILNELNPKAKILFNSIYNPFKEMKETNGGGLHWISVPSYYAPSWYWDDWYTIPFTGGVFVDIGSAAENLLISLNEVIKNSISSLGNSNHCFVDVKNTFDKATYNYIYCDVVSKSRSIGGINTDNISNHIDVHPTAIGHYAIFETIKQIFMDNFSTVELKNVAEFVDGGIETIYLFNKNKIINQNELVQLYGNDKNELFAGWFKDSSFKNKWDFENDILTDKTTLYAKWSGLDCLDESQLKQLVNQTGVVNFTIDIEEGVEWFVNGEKQVGVGKDFAFTPQGNIASEYLICCKLGDKTSKSFKIEVEFFVPTAITIKSEQLGNGTYQFSVDDENAESIDENKLIWFKNQDGETTEIGKGTTIQLKEVEDCEVFVKYLGVENVKSNALSLKIEKPVDDIIENFDNENLVFNAQYLRETIVVGSLILLCIIYFMVKKINKIKVLKSNKSLLFKLIEKHKKKS